MEVSPTFARNVVVVSFVAPIAFRLFAASARKQWSQYFAMDFKLRPVFSFYHKVQTILSIPALLILIQQYYVPFLVWAETRSDVALATLDDPILNRFSPKDLSLPASILIYGALYTFL